MQLHKKASNGLAVVLALFAGAMPQVASAVAFGFLPVETGGSVQYSYSQFWNDGGGDTWSSTWSGTVNFSTHGFYRAPWYALLDANMALSLLHSTTDDSSANVSTSVTGLARMQLYPQSQFPFTALLQRSDNRLDPGEGNPQDRSITTLHLSQRYTPAGGQGQTSADYEHTITEQESGEKDVRDLFGVDYSHSLKEHEMRGSGRVIQTKRSPGSDSSIDLDLVFSDRYTPRSRWAVDTDFGFNREEDELSGIDSIREQTQLVSTAVRRREEEEPLSLFVTARAYRSGAGSGTITEHVNTYNVTSAASYRLSERWEANGSVGVGLSDSTSRSAINHNESASISYGPPEIDFDGYNYSWGTSGGITNSWVEDGESRQTANARISHGLSSGFELAPQWGNLYWSLGQNGTVEAEKGEGPTWSLSHGAGVRWNRQFGETAQVGSFNVSDRRTIGGSVRDSTFQLINIQFDSNTRINNEESWDGSLTIQGTRDDLEGLSGDFEFSSSGRLGYRKRTVLGVPRLSYRTELSVSSEELIPVLASSDESETLSWDNRLDYRIGRLSTRANLRYSETGSNSGVWYLRFTVRRDF